MGTEGPPPVRGWGCTPTGDVPSDATSRRCLPAQITVGWRRTLLYGILATLMMLVFLNIALTLWIIASLRLTMNGIGPLSIVAGGVQLRGQAIVTDRLIASSLASRAGQPLVFHSYRNFSVLVSQLDKREQSKFSIKRDSIECGGRMFDVSDARGTSIFRASRDKVRIAADVVTLEGAGGVAVRAALQTPLVRAPPGSDLELESQTRGLELKAPQSINLESRAGGIEVASHSDLKLRSVVGAIRLDAADIYLTNLRQGIPPDTFARSRPKRFVRVYQMCACASGKIFLAAPESPCVIREDDRDVCQ